MKIKPVLLVAVAMTTGYTLADETHRQHTAHVHGHATATLAISGTTVQIDIDSPAMNLLGFEHEPASDQEHQFLEDAVSFLRKPERWIDLGRDAGCEIAHVDVDSRLLEHGNSADHAHKEDHDGHADFEISVEFNCKDAGRFETVDLSGLFQRFPGFEDIEVQWLTDQVQSSAELNAGNPVIRLR
jgi:hypothetical protein